MKTTIDKEKKRLERRLASLDQEQKVLLAQLAGLTQLERREDQSVSVSLTTLKAGSNEEMA